MFRFTIRDVLWPTVLVAVALTRWLAGSRETATLRVESAAREAKLQAEIVAEREKSKEKLSGLLKAQLELLSKSKMHEARADRLREELREEIAKHRPAPQ